MYRKSNAPSSKRWHKGVALGGAALILIAGLLIWQALPDAGEKGGGREGGGSRSLVVPSGPKAGVTTNEPAPIRTNEAPPKLSEFEIRFQEERVAFLRGWGKPMPIRVTSNHPLLHFYVQCLESPDPEVSRHAFQVLLDATGGTEIDSADGVYDSVDKRFFSRLFATKFQGALITPRDSFFAEKGLFQLVTVLVRQLDDEARREEVLRILNYATANVYEEKNAGWWQESFQGSKLAGMMAGLPDEEWIDRLE